MASAEGPRKIKILKRGEDHSDSILPWSNAPAISSNMTTHPTAGTAVCKPTGLTSDASKNVNHTKTEIDAQSSSFTSNNHAEKVRIKAENPLCSGNESLISCGKQPDLASVEESGQISADRKSKCPPTDNPDIHLLQGNAADVPDKIDTKKSENESPISCEKQTKAEFVVESEHISVDLNSEFPPSDNTDMHLVEGRTLDVQVKIDMKNPELCSENKSRISCKNQADGPESIVGSECVSADQENTCPPTCNLVIHSVQETKQDAVCLPQPMSKEGAESSHDDNANDSKQNASSESSTGQGNSESDNSVPLKCEETAQKPKKKVPDLPQDLGPLKIRCTSMSQEVLQLLSQKIKDDLVKTKESKDHKRTQELRELSWKVADCVTLGTSKVKKIEGKSAYQMRQEKEAERYKNRKSRQWKQPTFPAESSLSVEPADANQPWRRNERSSSRGRRGRSDQGQRSSTCDQYPRGNKFNQKDAKWFAKKFVRGVIRKAMEQLAKEQDEADRLKSQKEIYMATQLVDRIISSSIKTLISESVSVRGNLSLTESELLSDMMEDAAEDCSDQSFRMHDITDGVHAVVKNDPTTGC